MIFQVSDRIIKWIVSGHVYTFICNVCIYYEIKYKKMEIILFLLHMS